MKILPVKKEKKEKRTSARAANQKKEDVPKTPDADDEKPFDYGGLPERDLKKNLGCGG